MAAWLTAVLILCMASQSYAILDTIVPCHNANECFFLCAPHGETAKCDHHTCKCEVLEPTTCLSDDVCKEKFGNNPHVCCNQDSSRCHVDNQCCQDSLGHAHSHCQVEEGTLPPCQTGSDCFDICGIKRGQHGACVDNVCTCLELEPTTCTSDDICKAEFDNNPLACCSQESGLCYVAKQCYHDSHAHAHAHGHHHVEEGDHSCQTELECFNICKDHGQHGACVDNICTCLALGPTVCTLDDVCKSDFHNNPHVCCNQEINQCHVAQQCYQDSHAHAHGHHHVEEGDHSCQTELECFDTCKDHGQHGACVDNICTCLDLGPTFCITDGVCKADFNNNPHICCNQDSSQCHVNRKCYEDSHAHDHGHNHEH